MTSGDGLRRDGGVTYSERFPRMERSLASRACRSAATCTNSWSYVGVLTVPSSRYVLQRRPPCKPQEETALCRHRGRQGRSGSRDGADIFGECLPLRAQPYRSVSSSFSRSCALTTLSSCFVIGYTRIILAALALHYMNYHPKYCTVLYCISCLLDAFDGHAARALGQSSKFGAVLDMVTDR